MAKLLFFAGSARTGSFNKKLASEAASIAKQEGADVTLIDLKNFEMPIYDGDLEASDSLPANAIKLKQLFIDHDGFYIASPEYNSSFSPLLKNALDWISRPHAENEAPLIAFKGKVAAVGATSPGGFGGLRGLVPLRMMLGNIGVHVVPTQTAIAAAHKVFDDQGQLTDAAHLNMLRASVQEFIHTTNALAK
tara:strand:+ start:64771 stop:65346 length:576 start_codon:yes stop_codon:yes gene_type:complete